MTTMTHRSLAVAFTLATLAAASPAYAQEACLKLCQGTTVTVANTSQPFYFRMERYTSDGSSPMADMIPIPTGYTLVVEQISGFVTGGGNTDWRLDTVTSSGGLWEYNVLPIATLPPTYTSSRNFLH